MPRGSCSSACMWKGERPIEEQARPGVQHSIISMGAACARGPLSSATDAEASRAAADPAGMAATAAAAAARLSRLAPASAAPSPMPSAPSSLLGRCRLAGQGVGGLPVRPSLLRAAGERCYDCCLP